MTIGGFKGALIAPWKADCDGHVKNVFHLDQNIAPAADEPEFRSPA